MNIKKWNFLFWVFICACLGTIMGRIMSDHFLKKKLKPEITIIQKSDNITKVFTLKNKGFKLEINYKNLNGE